MAGSLISGKVKCHTGFYLKYFLHKVLSIIYSCIFSPLLNQIHLIYATNNINWPDNNGNKLQMQSLLRESSSPLWSKLPTPL